MLMNASPERTGALLTLGVTTFSGGTDVSVSKVMYALTKAAQVRCCSIYSCEEALELQKARVCTPLHLVQFPWQHNAESWGRSVALRANSATYVRFSVWVFYLKELTINIATKPVTNTSYRWKKWQNFEEKHVLLVWVWVSDATMRSETQRGTRIVKAVAPKVTTDLSSSFIWLR